MVLLTAGVALWALAHFFKRLAPARRAEMGEKGKGLVAAAIGVSLLLMIFGYRGAEFIPVYTPIPGVGHLNNLLMLVSIYLFGVGSSKGVLASKLRHPMLLGMSVWAIAHLIVNGDVASLILFGGLLVWAVAEMLIINKAEGPWQAPAPGPRSKDFKLVGLTLLIYAVIAGIHTFLGYNPFQGTYG